MMTKKTKRKSRKPGRPKGATTSSIEVDVVATRCVRCGSSERSKYFGTPTTRDFPTLMRTETEAHGPVVFNRIIYRRCRCKCGQVRIERTYERI